ncbi:hypothetical protein Q763_15955 [Flavobacterium beibuense F44-8]|uniref:Uncharacterized protein n=1 Tax=Flavobacterium beibuense F44-8 TaxID=1406840 RepID=A0A0A2LG55_9FLAO|nr:hypothetical protein Q763_15955 [Flavobacterium beibuense F44-8]
MFIRSLECKGTNNYKKENEEGRVNSSKLVTLKATLYLFYRSFKLIFVEILMNFVIFQNLTVKFLLNKYI